MLWPTEHEQISEGLRVRSWRLGYFEPSGTHKADLSNITLCYRIETLFSDLFIDETYIDKLAP